MAPTEPLATALCGLSIQQNAPRDNEALESLVVTQLDLLESSSLSSSIDVVMTSVNGALAKAKANGGVLNWWAVRPQLSSTTFLVQHWNNQELARSFWLALVGSWAPADRITFRAFSWCHLSNEEANQLKGATPRAEMYAQAVAEDFLSAPSADAPARWMPLIPVPSRLASATPPLHDLADPLASTTSRLSTRNISCHASTASDENVPAKDHTAAGHPRGPGEAANGEPPTSGGSVDSVRLVEETAQNHAHRVALGETKGGRDSGDYRRGSVLARVPGEALVAAAPELLSRNSMSSVQSVPEFSTSPDGWGRSMEGFPHTPHRHSAPGDDGPKQEAVAASGLFDKTTTLRSSGRRPIPRRPRGPVV